MACGLPLWENGGGVAGAFFGRSEGVRLRDIRLGSVLGFEIRIDFSWFIIFFLILWTFTTLVFPANVPGLSRLAYIGMGVVGTLLFFISLLAHELSHSLVARAKGIPVEGITLFIFGGMAKTRMEAEEPGDEFLIAGVGPLASILIGLLFVAVWWLGSLAGLPLAVTGVALYIGFLNILLAVFNLLPGFPLDGGRLFRAIVWKVTGDLTKATRYATTGGKWTGYLLMGLGVAQFFMRNLIGGVWLIFIGWFLRSVAIASYEQHRFRQVLNRVPAEQTMTPRPETVSPDLTVQELVDDHFLGPRRHRAFPVTSNGHPLGIVTLDHISDISREDWTARRVRDVMTGPEDTIVVRPDDNMVQVLEKMQGAGAGQALVARDGHLEGIITLADVKGWLDRARQLEESQ